MEKLNEMEQKRLVDELNQGRELASQLKNHLGPIIASKETCENLVQSILSSYDNALAVLNWTSLLQDPIPIGGGGGGLVESPQSSHGGSKLKCQKNVFKKRNKLPKWREQVRVCTGKGLEGRIDDGFSWRKYGQKEIFGAKNPRAYYRCTHKHTRSCLATKQVQKSDEDPSILEVTYKGNHTCMQISNETAKENIIISQQQHSTHFNNIGQNLKVETEDLKSNDNLFPSFPFPSTTPIESGNLENQIFGELIEHNMFLGSYSPSFLSPSTSESNYFSMSSSRQINESDHADLISTPSSVNDSPFDSVFSIDQVNFDPDFSLDDLEYLS